MPSQGEPGRPAGGLARRAGLVGAGTLVSRLLGLLRDRVIAASFALEATDAFFVAFTIPNALRGLLAEGATSAAVVPLLAEARAQEGSAGARRFLDRFVAAMGAALALVCAAGVLAAPLLVAAYASGYLDDPARFALTTSLTRWVFPYILLIGVASVLTGALHAAGRFGVASLAPTSLNVGLLVAPFALVGPAVALGLAPVASLALGALLGGLLHVGVLALHLARMGLGPRPDLRGAVRDARVRRGFGLLGPLVVGVGVYQLNVLLGRQFASFLPVGAQSYLYYATRLVELPQGMVALAVASAALPAMAAQHQAHDAEAARRTLATGLSLVVFLSTPAAVLLAVAATPIVAVLFGVGEFDAADVRATAAALELLALGVVPVSAVRVSVPAFHARQETRAPVVAGVANLVAFSAIALAAMPALGHVGIALGIAVASCLQLAVLWALLARAGQAPDAGLLGRRLLRTAVAAAAAGAVAWALTRGGDWGQGSSAPAQWLRLALALGAAGATYLGLAAWLRAPELAELRARLTRRRR